MPVKLDQIEPGSKIGRWAVRKRLGEGSMGMVFEVFAEGKRAALKLLRPELIVSTKHRARFEREAVLMQRVVHPNVVRLFETGEADGYVYLVLELIEGESLSKRLHKGRLPPDEVLRLAIDIFTGLLAVHSQGVLHRDVKPGNLLQGENGRWKLADFGLARDSSGDGDGPQITNVGSPIGTPPYMSPEVCQGFQATERSDLYSAGATLYHGAMGEPMYVEAKIADVMRAHIHGKPAEIARKDCPREIVELVRWCTQKDPEERPRSARDALRLLGVKVDAGPPKDDSRSETVELPPPKPAGSRSSTRTAALPKGPLPATPGQSKSGPVPAVPPPPKKPTDTTKKPGPNPLATIVTPPPAPPAPAPAPAPAPEAPKPAARQTGRAKAIRPASDRHPTPTLYVRPAAVDPTELAAQTKNARSLVWRRFALPAVLASAAVSGTLYVRHLETLGTPVAGSKVLAAVGIVLSPLLVLWAAIRLLLSSLEASIPRDAPVRTPWARFKLRQRVKRYAQSDPLHAAEALLQLGEHEEAGRLLFASGRYQNAGDALLRSGNLHAAAQAFERAKDPRRAIEAYVALGKETHAARIAFDVHAYEQAGELYEQAQKFDRAIDMYRMSGKRLRAADVLEKIGRHQAAADELVKIVADYKKSPRRPPKEELRELNRRAAALYDKAGAAVQAARLYESLDELPRAFTLYENAGALTKAAAVAFDLKQYADAARLYRQAGRDKEATRAEVEALLAEDKLPVAAARLESIGEHKRASELFEEVGAFADAARCALPDGDHARAAYMYARAGDWRNAGPLYEKVQAYLDAAKCYHNLSDSISEGRVLDRAKSPLQAAEAWAAAGKTNEALRSLESVEADSPERRQAQARRAVLLAGSGREREAVEAFRAAIEGAPLDATTGPWYRSLIDLLARMGELEGARRGLDVLRGTPYAPSNIDEVCASLDKRRRASNVAPVSSGIGEVRRVRGGADLVGQEIDRYTIRALLGEGGTSWVYRAEHVFLGRVSALKVMKPLPDGETKRGERFVAEGRMLALTRHTNLIEVYDCGLTEDGLLYMALEFVNGPSLRELMEIEKRLPWRQVCKLGAEVLAGLYAAHKAGIVHRDLKPENVLLKEGTQPKIVDFGIAKLFQSPKTMSGGFMGTPKYASPEQAMGKEIGPAADQYAVGIMLYEMIAGVTPFESATPMGYLMQHVQQAPRPIQEAVPDCPPLLASAIMRALEKDERARHVDVEAMRRVLASVAVNS